MLILKCGFKRHLDFYIFEEDWHLPLVLSNDDENRRVTVADTVGSNKSRGKQAETTHVQQLCLSPGTS